MFGWGGRLVILYEREDTEIFAFSRQIFSIEEPRQLRRNITTGCVWLSAILLFSSQNRIHFSQRLSQLREGGISKDKNVGVALVVDVGRKESWRAAIV